MTEPGATAVPGAAGSGRIFISYRREETAYPAGWLYDRLVDRFGGDQIFKDVDSIQLGDDFAEVIATAVGSCDMLVALIGDSWATITDEHGNRRLDDPDDLVRLEIEAALTRQVRVIPILVDGARMPRADELPETLARLVRRQALELSPSRFDTDLNRLVAAVEGTLAEVRNAQLTQAASGPGATAEAASPAAPGASAASGSGDAGDVVGVGPAPGQAAGPPQSPVTDSGEPPRGGSRRGWVLAAVGGGVLLVVLIGLLVALLADSDSTSSEDEAAGQEGAGASPGGVEVDTEPVTSPEEITVSGLDFDTRNDPPLIGDTATVTYTLTNDSDQEVTLAYTFVGVRNPDGDNRDAEDENEGAVLAPGQSLVAEGRRPVDSVGIWEFWPCYELADGTQCPDKWQVIFVPVSEG